MALCKHKMEEEWCAICQRGTEEQTKRAPARRLAASVHGAEALPVPTLERYVLVKTVGLHKDEDSVEGIGPKTEFVHIDGPLFVWVLKEIFKKAPNLKTIQVTPRQAYNLKDTHKKLCAGHGVVIRHGFHRPDLAWKEDENRSPHYQTQQRFLRTLADEQRALFEEAVKLGFKAAMITSRYFCLNGEKYIPLHKLAEEFGLDEQAGAPSVYVNAVIAYLDPSFKTSKAARQAAEALTTHVQKARAIVMSEQAQRAFCERLGIQQLPERLLASRLELFEKVLAAKRAGQIDALDSRLHGVLTDHFGLNAAQRCKTLQEIGTTLDVTRERVRQLMEQALSTLQIVSEEL